MTLVTVDQATRAKLHNLAEMLEFRDENGRVLGYYAPVRQGEHSPYQSAEIPFSEAEVRQLLNQPRGRPLAEILAELEKQG